MRKSPLIGAATFCLALGVASPAVAATNGGAQSHRSTQCYTSAEETTCINWFAVGHTATTPSKKGIVSVTFNTRWTYTVTYANGEIRSGAGIDKIHQLWKEGEEGILIEESVRYDTTDMYNSGITCTLVGKGHIVNGRIIFDRETYSCS